MLLASRRYYPVGIYYWVQFCAQGRWNQVLLHTPLLSLLSLLSSGCWSARSQYWGTCSENRYIEDTRLLEKMPGKGTVFWCYTEGATRNERHTHDELRFWLDVVTAHSA